MLPRGGCRVTSENSTIDATVEQRLGAAIAAVLGDERGRAGERRRRRDESDVCAGRPALDAARWRAVSNAWRDVPPPAVAGA